MYSLKKMTQKISKTYTLSFPKAAHSLEAQDQGGLTCYLFRHKLYKNCVKDVLTPILPQ